MCPLGRKSLVNKKHNLGFTALLKGDFESRGHSQVPDFKSTLVHNYGVESLPLSATDDTTLDIELEGRVAMPVSK